MSMDYESGVKKIVETDFEKMSSEDCFAYLSFLIKYLEMILFQQSECATSLCRAGLKIMKRWLSLVSTRDILSCPSSADVILNFMQILDLYNFEEERISYLMQFITIKGLTKKTRLWCLSMLFEGPYCAWMKDQVVDFRVQQLAVKANSGYETGKMSKALCQQVREFVPSNELLVYIEQYKTVFFRKENRSCHELMAPCVDAPMLLRNFDRFSIQIHSVTWWLETDNQDVSAGFSLLYPGLTRLFVPKTDILLQELPYAKMGFQSNCDALQYIAEKTSNSVFCKDKLYVGLWMLKQQ